MAARENQGLQIALIIFVILTIMLIVTSYFVFSSYTKERDRANSLAKSKSDSDSAASKAITEAEDFKLLIGGDPKLTIDNVKETGLADMQTHGEGLPESKQNYRALVLHMSDKLREYEAMNTKLTAETKDLTDKLKANQDASLAEVAQYKSKLDATAADLEGEVRRSPHRDQGAAGPTVRQIPNDAGRARKAPATIGRPDRLALD
jgi:hypothetical protein